MKIKTVGWLLGIVWSSLGGVLLITADLMIGMPQEFGSLPLALEGGAFQTTSPAFWRS